MKNVTPIFSYIELPADAVTAARRNLHRATLELIRASIEIEDKDSLNLGQDIALVLNEAEL